MPFTTSHTVSAGAPRARAERYARAGPYLRFRSSNRVFELGMNTKAISRVGANIYAKDTRPLDLAYMGLLGVRPIPAIRNGDPSAYTEA